MKNISEQTLLRVGTSQANATQRFAPCPLSKSFPLITLQPNPELFANGTPQVIDALLDYKIDIAFYYGQSPS